MVSFEYNPFAESVTLEYICPRCGHKNTEIIVVPTPDWSAESHHASMNSDNTEVYCRNCGSDFQVTLATGIYGGEGEINVDVLDNCIENIPGDDDNYYDQLLFKETHSDTEKALDAIEGLPKDIKDNLYRLLYANIISKMEAFLCDTIVSYVLECDEHKKTFVQKYEPLATQKFQMSAIFAKYDALDRTIKDALTSIVYHDMVLVRKLYKNVVGIDLPYTKEIEDAIQVRHHIIHRNGKDKEGNIINIKKEDVEDLSNIVYDFIYEIDNLISYKRVASFVTDVDLLK